MTTKKDEELVARMGKFYWSLHHDKCIPIDHAMLLTCAAFQGSAVVDEWGRETRLMSSTIVDREC